MSWPIGKKHSLESIEKMRSAQKGRKVSKEQRQKLSIAHKGKKLSEIHRLHIIQGRSHITQFGKDNPNWKGGKIIQNGYVKVKINGKYIPEHRVIMEKYLGHSISRDERVHHINGIKTDNRIENLVVITNEEHSRKHRIEEVNNGTFKKIRPLFGNRKLN